MNTEERQFIEELYRKYYRVLSKEIHSIINNKSDTADIVNMAFEWCIKNYSQGRVSQRSMYRHIKGVCIHVARQMNKREDIIESQYTSAVIVNKDPAEIAINTERAERIIKTIKKMNSNYSQVLLLSIEEGLRPCEIAQRLSLKSNTASKRLHRGIEKLALKLKESGYIIN